MYSEIRFYLLVLVIIAIYPSLIAAQNRQRLDDRSESGNVTTTEVVRLSFTKLDMAPGVLTRVFSLPDGGWGASSRNFDGEIQLFNSLGVPASTLGRAGEGPGEFGGPVFGVATDNELWVVDPQNGRLSVYSADLSLKYDRLIPGRVFFASSSFDESGIIVSGFMHHAGDTHSVARLSLDDATGVFGGPMEDHPNPRVQVQMAVQVKNREIWAVAVQGGGVNVLRSTNLSLIDQYQLPADIMVDKSPRQRGEENPPPPQIAGVMADEFGLIWVVIGVPDREWSPDLDPDAGARARWDTRLVAIDAERRAVIGPMRLDALCMPVEGRRISCVDPLAQVIRILQLRRQPVAETRR